jgi:hypothetical protein
LHEIMKGFIQLNMIRKSNWIFLSAGILILVAYGCSTENALERAIRVELETGGQKDSLFLGLEFGIDKQEFYDRCWALNKQGLVTQGVENMSVRYMFDDSLKNRIEFNFYVDDREGGQIHRYNTAFYYYAFALNRRLQSDRLMEMLPPILMEWYGGNEIFTMMKDGKQHYYKIDGNRMIDLFIFDEKTVIALYTDLSHYSMAELLK